MTSSKPSFERSISQGIKEETYVYKNSDESYSMMLRMNELQKEGRYCDIKLIVGMNRKEIQAHKIVLYAFSKYFEGLLNPNMKEGHQDEIEILNLEGEAFQRVIAYAYSGEITITPENVTLILETANFLAIDSICNACCNYLSTNLNSENCLGIFQCADMYGFPTLRDEAFMCISRNFHEVSKSEDLYLMGINMFKEIIDSEKMLFKVNNQIPKPDVQEWNIYLSVARYINNKNLETGEAINLLESVRFPVINESGEECCKQIKNISVQTKDFIHERVMTESKSVFEKDCEPWKRPRKSGAFRRYKNGPFGTQGYGHFRHCQHFDDKEVCNDSYVCGMDIWIRRWDGRPVVGGMKMTYKNDVETSYGITQSGPNVQHYSFNLKGDEYIKNMRINSGWLIDGMSFISSKGSTYGPYGGDGGAERDVKCFEEQNGFLAYVSGEVVTSQGSKAVRGISFVWKYYDTEKEEEESDTDVENQVRDDYYGYDEDNEW